MGDLLNTRAIIIAIGVAMAAPSSAQNDSPAAAAPDDRAAAAGYVALTTCSAVTTARRLGEKRDEAGIRANELAGTYGGAMGALIDSYRASVFGSGYRVDWDERMPPRIALYDPKTGGCKLMPAGYSADEKAIGLKPDTSIRLTDRWPVGDKDASAPTQGNSAALNAIIEKLFGREYGKDGKTTAVVIVQSGRIVAERYADGFGIYIPQRTWSVAKSLNASIIGAAVLRGEVSVEKPASIANWQHGEDPRRAITLDNLLRMGSGLVNEGPGNSTGAIYFGGTAIDEQSPGLPLLAPPGSTFRYSNHDSMLAAFAIASSFKRHPPRAFFDSIDMHATVAETDWRGNYVLSSQVWTTARDLARFGMLYLNNGVWQGKRILPENWRTYVSSATGPQPQDQFGYGASFWLLNKSEGIPADTFAAFGSRGQYVVIVPSRNIVIVRRGEDPRSNRFDIATFTRDVLAALSN